MLSPYRQSRGQGRMIQVSIPASVPLKEFDYNAEEYSQKDIGWLADIKYSFKFFINSIMFSILYLLFDTVIW